MKTQNVINMINSNPRHAKKALETVYHSKTFVAVDVASECIDGFYKTKRGAEGYIKRQQSVSYYDEMTFKMVTCGSSLEVFEIPASEIVDPATNVKIWYKHIKSLFSRNWLVGDALSAAKHYGVSEEVLTYVEKAVNEALTEGSFTNIEKYEEKEIEAIQEVNEITTTEEAPEQIETVIMEENANQGTSGAVYTTGTGSKGNGIEITFTEKPSEEVRNAMKAIGYRWGGKKRPSIWWAIMDENTISLAKQLVGETVLESKIESDYLDQLTPAQKETLSTRLQKEHVKPLRLYKASKGNSILLECVNANLETNESFYFLITDSGIEHGKGYNFEYLNEYTLIYNYDNKVAKEQEEKPSFSYPEINIDDVTDEKYNINQQLQDREHDSAWIFRKEKKDHNKELQEYFTECNNKVLEAIGTTNNEYYIYKLKEALQRHKKNYHAQYVKYLNHRASNPSWVITGRGNMNVSRYNNKMDQQSRIMMELATMPEEFNKLINKYENKIYKDKQTELNEQLQNELNQPLPDLKFKTINKEVDIYGSGRLFNVRFYECEGYLISKIAGAFRVYNSKGKELWSAKSKGKLSDAKAYVSLLIKKDRDQSQKAV
ncbi:hypothetical protein BAOM_3079 [Peribacillus asahii]|uniref:Uncharacterized protein n=1 Tax=Peribacillus asahii TaxID=228899 RepID=A0A3Q9RP67_9BACI|nr:hypothetical protein [Peribacillus asahii]AZV43688.1 hypothetical protein BAOM_3079 [Peribacillus asahii]